MSCTDSREYLDKKYILPVTLELFSNRRIKGATFCTQSTGRTLDQSLTILKTPIASARYKMGNGKHHSC